MRASGDGSGALGLAAGADIIASGEGARAHGSARTNDILASGPGSFAHGASSTGLISASGTNSIQFGVGANALANSLQIGNAGLRLKGTVAAPGTLQNGDIWVDAAGQVFIRSSGISVGI
jgi:hypothetical protein